MKTRFNSAIDDRQHEDVARFVKLFKPLNKKVCGTDLHLHQKTFCITSVCYLMSFPE